MQFDPTQLLRQLASGIRLPGLPATAPNPAAATGSTGFAELLQQARDGGLVSKQPVTIEPGINVSLTDDQLARLSLAADKAEASGIRTALVILDDQQLVMDVRTRMITGRADLSSGQVSGINGVAAATVGDGAGGGNGEGLGGVLSGIDGVINLSNALSGSGGAQASPLLALPSGSPPGNLSVARLLAHLAGLQ